MAVEERGAFVNLSFDRAQSGHLSSADKALLVQLVYGTVSMQLALDYQLNLLLSRPLGTVPTAIRQILRLGAFQIMFLDRIPRHAAVNESVVLARRFGHEGTQRLVNAVLRRLSSQEHFAWPSPAVDLAQYLSVRFSHPRFLVERYLQRLGPMETEALLQKNNTPPRLSIRVNTTKTTVNSLVELLMAQGVTVQRGEYVPEILYPHPTPSFEDQLFVDGLYSVQGEASALCARFLEPEPHDKVADLCAAPGGKSTHIAELMSDLGTVWAFDRNKSRLSLVKTNASRLGLSSIRPVNLTAEEALAVVGEIDKVLLDAPCSGLGVLRHKPDLRWRHTPEATEALAVTQRRLILAAATLVRPGGTLVYSVCTTEPEETEMVASYLLSRRDDFSVVPEPPPGVQGLHPDGELGYYFWPHRHNIDGFYIARFRRAGI